MPVTPLDSPFPGGRFLQPVGSSLGLGTRNGDNFSFRNPDFKVPYTDLWMAGVNLELPWAIGLDVAYVGNKVTGLTVTRDVNIIPIEEQQKGIATYTGELTASQLQIDSPYNTRTHKGLPPTPIANPGEASIAAAEHPAHASYLYYVLGIERSFFDNLNVIVQYVGRYVVNRVDPARGY